MKVKFENEKIVQITKDDCIVLDSGEYLMIDEAMIQIHRGVISMRDDVFGWAKMVEIV